MGGNCFAGIVRASRVEPTLTPDPRAEQQLVQTNAFNGGTLPPIKMPRGLARQQARVVVLLHDPSIARFDHQKTHVQCV